jgi:hypothetical protein
MQDAGELAALMEKVVGPFGLKAMAGSENGLDGRSDDPGREVWEARP